MRKYSINICFALSFIISCRQSYISPAIQNNPSFLVVDGFINSGQGPTVLTLSRTANLSTQLPSPELNATVNVLDENGNAFALTEKGNGVYSISQVPVDYNKKYRVQILTANSKQYLSDLVTPKKTPAIDSIPWELNNNGVNIFVNTHDPGNNSRYYRWEFAETWERHAFFDSQLKFMDSQIQLRDPADQIFHCWKTDSATNLLVGSSANLQEDIIYRQPILSIDQGAEQLKILYNIIIYQYVISKEAFVYWQNLKKNTEQLGSLFDAQPMQPIGNLHCVSNPAEPVLGYMSASSVNQKRIFISNTELAFWYYVPAFDCQEMLISSDQIQRIFSDTLLFVPITSGISGIYAAGVECGDCRYSGAVNKKPSFWP